ncbi:hypothetical protein DFH28DRAFT_1052414 [Melampsora americana]|nr:hypothetical protein DFH28DRAFT_1052414 [Melampsora americana]
MIFFTSNLSLHRILFIVLPAFFIHLQISYSAPSFRDHGIIKGSTEIIEGSHEIIRGSPEIIEASHEITPGSEIIEGSHEITEGSPEITEEEFQSFDSPRWNGGSHYTGLPMQDTITQDPSRDNMLKPSTLTQTTNSLLMEKKKSANDWFRIYYVGNMVSESESFIHIKGIIDTVLKIGSQNFPPSLELIERDLIIPTFHALQDSLLNHFERMWAVAVLSYVKNASTSSEFEDIFQSFVNLQTPTKLKKVNSLKRKIKSLMEQDLIIKERTSATLENDYMKQMILHLDKHHPVNHSWKSIFKSCWFM